MRTRPEVSVIIPCHDGAATLPLQLEALATQEDAPPFEVLLVDNRSTDGLAEVLSSEVARALPLRRIQADEAQGASYARNVGIARSRAHLLMFCDADDVVSRWWLRQGVKTFEVSPLWSGSAILLSDADLEGSLHRIRETFGDSPDWRPPVHEQTGAFPVLMGGNFGATREVLAQLGGFDQSLPSAGEDNDLAFRAQRAGIGVPVAKTVRIGYRGKWDLSSRVRLAHASAGAHALIATRYDAWGDSPYPPWPVELARTAGSGLKLALRRERDWSGWRLRAAAATGLAKGAIRYRLPGGLPESDLWSGESERS